MSHPLTHVSVEVCCLESTVNVPTKKLIINSICLSPSICLVLAFTPPNDAVDAFERLTDLIRNQYGDTTDGVLDYFEDTYIGRFTRNAARATKYFPIQMWNIFHLTYEELPRTITIQIVSTGNFRTFVCVITQPFGSL